MRRSGNGSSVANVERANAVTGPISTKCVSRTQGRGVWRRVTCHAACEARSVSGPCEVESEVLGEQQEAVEEPVWQHDVVVHHEQPVVGLLGRVGIE